MARISAGRRVPADPFASEARYYDLYWAGMPDLAFYRRLARGLDPVLDAMCGTGRLAISLARCGHRVVGIDASPSMLRAARRRARELPSEVRGRLRFRRADVRRFRSPMRFGFVVVAANSLSLLPSETAVRGTIRRLAALLGTRGRMVLHLDPPESYDLHAPTGPRLVGTRALEQRGRRYLRVVRERPIGRDRVETVTRHLTVGPGSRVVREEVTRTRSLVLRRTLVESALRDAGLRVETVYGDYRGGKRRPGSPALVFSARPDR